ncbi:MAG: glycosylase, partial [Planctomycetota bacterium]
VSTALASTTDFQTFTRHGIIFPPENKDVVLFPERIGGRFVALHRPVGATRFTRPEIWVAESDNLLDWGNHRPVDVPCHPWNADRVGGGCPPRPHPAGWLTIIHGAERPAVGGEVGRYRGAWMLLDRNNPSRVLHVDPIDALTPQEPFETSGFVPHVVFPTGWVEVDGACHVFYGASDCYVGVASFQLQSAFPRQE